MTEQTKRVTLDDLWLAYAANIHGYNPDALPELEAAFKSGAWALAIAITSPKHDLRPMPADVFAEYEAFKARRRKAE